MFTAGKEVIESGVGVALVCSGCDWGGNEGRAIDLLTSDAKLVHVFEEHGEVNSELAHVGTPPCTKGGITPLALLFGKVRPEITLWSGFVTSAILLADASNVASKS